MAIKDDNDPQAQQGGANQSLFNSNKDGGWGLQSIARQSGITRLMTSETLRKATEAIQGVLNELPNIPEGFDLIAVQIDNQRYTNLHFSSIVLVARDTKIPESPLAYHVLMLEGSGPKLQPIQKTIPWNGINHNVQVDRLPSDAYNTAYRTTVEDILTQTFEGKLLSCAGQQLPADFNLEDKKALTDLVYNVVLPVILNLSQRRPGFVDMNLGKFNRDSSFFIQHSFHNKDKTDYAGQPLRDSFNIKLIGQSNQNNNSNSQEINSEDKQTIVSEISGYIEPVWSPAPQQQMMPNQFYSGYQQQMPQQKYLGRVIMTRMENMLTQTIAAQLFALTSVASLSESFAWFPYFSPRPLAGKKDIDFNDIGILNIEAAVYPNPNDPNGRGLPVDTKSISHTEQIQGEYLSRLIRGLSFSLDVSEFGPDTFQNDVFWEAATGNQNANLAILEAANLLTNGNFAKNFDMNGQFMQQGTESVFAGYFVNSDGQKQDIRALDYLALMNILGPKNPAFGEEYSQIWFGNMPEELRLDKIRKLLQDVSRADITFTGRIARLTFNPAAIGALVKSVRSTGLDIKLISSALGINYQNTRAAFDIGGSGVFDGNNAGLFHSGYTNQQSTFGVGRGPSNSRY